MSSRYIEMIEAEKQRLGVDWSDDISPTSPPLLRAGILATFLIELEMGALVGKIDPRTAEVLRKNFRFVLLATGGKDILKSREFNQALFALRDDYRDAATGAFRG